MIFNTAKFAYSTARINTRNWVFFSPFLYPFLGIECELGIPISGYYPHIYRAARL
jgi:hypothetical protein